MVEVSYRNANYDSGNQSTLFSFDFDDDTQRYGVLVDSGPGLDLDGVLLDDEYLSATLLTHAHRDHIDSIEECLRDGAPIYASPDTVAALTAMLDVDPGTLGIDDPAAVADRLEPLDSTWTPVGKSIEVRPVPVGHAPGATGFLIRFSGHNHIFVTGDFTLHDVAGNPGLDPTLGGTLAPASGSLLTDDPTGVTDGEFAIGALHVNVPTRERATGALESAVARIHDRVSSGASTLVTTGSLSGVHVAGLLDAVQRQHGSQFEVVLAGKAAAVYDALGYDFPRVSSVVEFQDARALLSRGQVTIAGPEDASAGSAGRLLEAANQRAGDMAVVQLRSAGTEQVRESWLTSYDFEYSLHPSQSEIVELVERIAPVQLIVGHTTDKTELKRWRDRGSDLETLVWASYGTDRYRLFDSGAWLAPPWVDSPFVNTVLQRAESRPEASVDAELLPAIGAERPSLRSEGIGPDSLAGAAESLTGPPSTGHGDADHVVELDAGVVHLAELVVAGDARPPDGRSVVDLDALVLDAVDWFVGESLRDGVPQGSTAPGLLDSVSVRADTPFERILAAQAGPDTTPTEFAVDVLRERLDLPSDVAVEYANSGLRPRLPYLRALVESDDNEFADPGDAVQAALESYLDS